MNNEELIAKIKAEIERQRENILFKVHHYPIHRIELLDDLLSFLSTLESEKPMNLEDGLEEEIKRYGEKNMFNIPAFQQVARHFAEWGAEHAEKGNTPVPKDLEEAAEKCIDDALFKWSYDDEDGIEQYVHDAFVAGAKWQKEQLMKEAVETEVVSRVTNKGLLPAVTFLVDESYKEGDKIKVLIVK